MSRYTHPAEEKDLLSVIDQEADRMNDMLTDSIRVSADRSGSVTAAHRGLPLDDPVPVMLERLRTFLDERPVNVNLAAGFPAVYADGHLIGLVLRQLVHNAVKYSHAGSPITISASAQEDTVAICIGIKG